MDKVKYTSKEYREEYLKSDHWKTLRGYIVSSGVMCFKCKSAPATDAHHMQYRHLVDVKIDDLVPLCRPCHLLVEEAKDAGMVKGCHSKKTLLKISRGSIDAWNKKMNDLVPIPAHMIERMLGHGPKCYKVVFGIIKRTVSIDEWGKILVTGRQLWKIHGAVPKKWKDSRHGVVGVSMRRSVKNTVLIHY